MGAEGVKMENWLEIDLNRLRSNYTYIKSKTNSTLCAVIKADGYGIGSYEIAKELENLGVKNFAVAFLKEAEELRGFGIRSEILILNYISPEKLKNLVDEKIVLTIYSLEQLKKYFDFDDLKGKRFHIKLNTGMNRLGFGKEEIDELVKISKEKNLNIEGIYTHFAHVDDEEFTKKQYEKFFEMSESVEKQLNKSLIKHVANSAATLKYKNYGLDFVRVGMGLYGLQALENYDSKIKSIITWKSKITNIREVEIGERISYGREVLNETKKIAIIPVGYSHGYMRQLSDKAYILIKGRKVRIIGKIFMDQMVVDITDTKNIKVGDEVILLGDGVEAEEIALFSGTIADDIISKISPRIKRIFIK